MYDVRDVKDVQADTLGSSLATTAPPLGDTLGSTLASNATDPYLHGRLAPQEGPTYPRIVTAYQLLEESDDESIFCGPPSEPEDRGLSEILALEVLGLVDKPFDPRLRAAGRGATASAGSGSAAARPPGGAVPAAPGLQAPSGAGDYSAPAFSATAGSFLDGEGYPEAPGLRVALPPGAIFRGAEADPWDRGPAAPGLSLPDAGTPPAAAAGAGGSAAAEAAKRQQPQALIMPRGDVEGDNQKFICVFQIGLEDDEEFCLVKRILGKAGNNMRRIAEECSAKVRLRGIGSGFLEGSDGKEANMPLQLNVSCTDFESYSGAVDRVATLLRDLYKHYRRYARSKGMEPPDVKIALEEVRRDDLNLDLLSQKAQRSPSQRERDRRAREQERRAHRDRERERERDAMRQTPAGAESEERGGGNAPLTEGAAAAAAGAAALGPAAAAAAAAGAAASAGGRSPGGLATEVDSDEARASPAPVTLPGGLPVPTTAAGRRAAARAGGAQAAAIASALAREQERMDRHKAQQERDRQRDIDRAEREKTRRGKGALKGGKSKATPIGGYPDDDLWRTSAAKVAGAVAGGFKGKSKAPPPPPPWPPPPDSAMEVHPFGSQEVDSRNGKASSKRGKGAGKT